ncbi:MAG TPA: hypothetical protein VJP88_09820 [Caulobacteraceae bacterium]|nr:hypothetical protein [Caulobacteraceae bacterium]
MPDSNGQFILAAVALAILGALAIALVFRTVPASNHDYLVFILGTVAGAVSTSAGVKIGQTLKKTGEGEGTQP